MRTAYCSLPLRTALAQPHEPLRGTSPCGLCADATMIERDCDGASWGSSMTFAPRRCRERCAWCSTSDATKSQRRCRAVAQVHCASPRPPPPTHPLLAYSFPSSHSPAHVACAELTMGETAGATRAVADRMPMPMPMPTSAVFAAAAARRIRRHRHNSRRRRRRATAVATAHIAHRPPPVAAAATARHAALPRRLALGTASLTRVAGWA